MKAPPSCLKSLQRSSSDFRYTLGRVRTVSTTFKIEAVSKALENVSRVLSSRLARRRLFTNGIRIIQLSYALKFTSHGN